LRLIVITNVAVIASDVMNIESLRPASILRVSALALVVPALLSLAACKESEGNKPDAGTDGPDATAASRQALLTATSACVQQTTREFLTAATALCSLIWANNETGVVQPVAEVARACRQRGILFHTDAVQVAGKLPLSLREVDADLLALSAYKFGGPVGAGALVVRKGVDVEALTPGHQEAGRRGGTQNVAYAEALALALERASADQEASCARVGALRDAFEREVLARIADVTVNGGGVSRVPNTSNLHFHGADGEALLIALDLEGICVSSGSACASGTLTPSHVLTAMGLTPAQAHGSLRFSLGASTTAAEVERVVQALCTHVPRSRELAARELA